MPPLSGSARCCRVFATPSSVPAFALFGSARHCESSVNRTFFTTVLTGMIATMRLSQAHSCVHCVLPLSKATTIVDRHSQLHLHQSHWSRRSPQLTPPLCREKVIADRTTPSQPLLQTDPRSAPFIFLFKSSFQTDNYSCKS